MRVRSFAGGPFMARRVRRAVPGSNEAQTKGRVDMLGPFVQFFVRAHILVAASGGPPKIDVEATCRASEKDLRAIFGSELQQTIDACVKQESAAFEQIKKNWATYPAAAKMLCVQPRVYSPSYVEWLTCF